MRIRTLVTALTAACCLASTGGTSFGTSMAFDGGGGDSDWFKPTNWNPNEAPVTTDDIATITSGFTVDFAGAGTTLIGGVTLGGAGSAGVLNVNSGILDVNRTGSPAPANNVRVGVGAGSVGTLNIAQGAEFYIRGGSARAEMGDAAGGAGTVSVAGSFVPFKSFRLINGTLEFLPTGDTIAAVGSGFNEGNTSTIGANGTLAYVINGASAGLLDMRTESASGTTLTIDGSSDLAVTLQAGPTYTVGQQWTLVRYENITGQFSQGASFTNDRGYGFTVDYAADASNKDVVLELTVIPSAGMVLTVR